MFTIKGADSNSLAFARRHDIAGAEQMKFEWRIDAKDINRVRALVESQSGNALIRARKERNLAATKPSVTKERFWRAMVSMRLTTRQKSGPESHVARFIRQNPFPLAYAEVQRARKPADLIAKTLFAIAWGRQGLIHGRAWRRLSRTERAAVGKLSASTVVLRDR